MNILKKEKTELVTYLWDMKKGIYFANVDLREERYEFTTNIKKAYPFSDSQELMVERLINTLAHKGHGSFIRYSEKVKRR